MAKYRQMFSILRLFGRWLYSSFKEVDGYKDSQRYLSSFDAAVAVVGVTWQIKGRASLGHDHESTESHRTRCEGRRSRNFNSH